MPAKRVTVGDAAALEVLAHPVRQDLLNFLMANGPATASVCARAVGDKPSNCSYHLRTLARHGFVESQDSTDGRERPWRAAITGFSVDDSAEGVGRQVDAVLGAALQLEQGRARAYLTRRGEESPAWRAASAYAFYGLRVTSAELEGLSDQIDALVRPYLAATRTDVPPHARTVRFAFQGYPQP